eukprot:5160192-Alexandrium_andersonii.AAC.1
MASIKAKLTLHFGERPDAQKFIAAVCEIMLANKYVKFGENYYRTAKSLSIGERTSVAANLH